MTVVSARDPLDHVRLDAGEASALAIAERGEKVLASDDAAARKIARARSVPVTGSIGLLVRGVVRDELAVETANEWLDQWVVTHDYRAPVDDVHDALPGRDAADR